MNFQDIEDMSPDEKSPSKERKVDSMLKQIGKAKQMKVTRPKNLQRYLNRKVTAD